MNKQLANKLIEASNDLGADAKLYEEYSGRGMYGETTCGVSFRDTRDMFCCIAYVAGEFEPGSCEVEDMQDDLSSLRVDEMGRGTIYY